MKIISFQKKISSLFQYAPILFLHYEPSVCPLILNYNKVYLVSSLIAKPNDNVISKYYFCSKTIVIPNSNKVIDFDLKLSNYTTMKLVIEILRCYKMG